MSDSKKVSTGFLWLTAQLLATKGAAFFSQFILLQFLAPEDFGLFGLALTVNLLTMVMQSTGIRDLLVTRKRSFARLSKTSFALALLLGMFSTILAIGASPLLVWCYATDRPETLRILILILAIQPLIASFGVVPFSKLNSESRFKEIAILGVVRGMVDSVLRVALAISGMGVLSLVISQVAATLCSTMGAIYLAWPRMTGVVRGFALKKVAIANFSFTAGNFFLAAFEFIDYSILGVFSTGPLGGTVLRRLFTLQSNCLLSCNECDDGLATKPLINACQITPAIHGSLASESAIDCDNCSLCVCDFCDSRLGNSQHLSGTLAWHLADINDFVDWDDFPAHTLALSKPAQGE